MTTKLYSYFRSSSAWRVRIALAWKGIPYEYAAVNLLKGEQRSFEFGIVNPLHAVPALVIDGHTLAESLPIVEYLEETRPAPALLPHHPFLRAKARQIAELVASDTQPLQNLRVLEKLDREYKAGDEGRKAWARHWIAEGLGVVEKVLGETAGTYCVGEQVTVADVFLVPQVANARRFGVDLAPFPGVVRIDATLGALDAFRAAVPGRQPDCPPELRES